MTEKAGPRGGSVEITPAEFAIVYFDGEELASLAEGVAVGLGLLGERLCIEVDEGSPNAMGVISSVSPVVLAIPSGALEDQSRPRHLGRSTAVEELARLLQRVVDRRSPEFAGAPAEEELTSQQGVAWDASALGRAAARGIEVHKARRRYQFLLRHGFTDEAEGAFERLWNEPATWADITELCQVTAASGRGVAPAEAL
ncbi:MAG: hypothetical protein ACYCSJ_12185 [Acidimicrobiales bacterium]